MSYWYEAKKEDIKIDGDEVDVYLGTQPAYDDCGNIYVTMKLKDLKEVIYPKQEVEYKTNNQIQGGF